MPLISKYHYRSEIDGLRAVAVLAVILFHAGFSFSGGYVGVDVFFVISGFLIASLIWRDLERGHFTFLNFWERRARRIVPALVVVTVVTLVAGWFLLLPAGFKSLGRASTAQAIFAANIHYLQDSGYFAPAASEKPLLHTWSLAVEEQFYLLVPFLLWGMFRATVARNRRRAVVLMLSIGFIFSFSVSINGVNHNPQAAFYLLQTRAWELLLGALVAFLPQLSLLRRGLRELFALAGLSLILIPVFIYVPETPFPGLAALPPCLGAALIIWANGRNDGRAPTYIGALLSLRPVVFIGLISYSLYLWHWPLLAFSRYLALAPLSFGYRAAMLGLGFLFATLSWKYVEMPFRVRRFGASRKSVFIFAGAGLATILGGGLLIMTMQGFPQRFPAQALEFANATSDRSSIHELTTDDIRARELVPIGVTNRAQRPTVLVWGDSHAMAVLPAIDAFLKEKGLSGRVATHSMTAPVLNWFLLAEWGLNKESIAFNDAVFSYIRDHDISTVILSASWSTYAESGSKGSGPFNDALLATIQRLIAIDSDPWILLDVPTNSFDVPRALSRSVISRTDITSLYTKPKARNKLDKMDRKTMAEVVAAGGRILDPKPRFLDPTGQYYVVQANGIALYRDYGHLTTEGAKLMLLPLFRHSLTLKE